MARQRAGASSAAGNQDETAAEIQAQKATLDEALAELGGAALEVVLFQQDRNAPTQWPYVGGFPAVDFSLESVRREHGGGNYRARILGPQKQFRKQVTFQIAGPPKSPAPPAAAASPPGPAPETVAILEAIKANAEAVRTLAAEVKAMQAAGARPAVDPLEQALKIADLVTRSAGSGRGQSLGISDMLELVDRGIELAGNGSGEAGGYVTVVREFGKPLLELLQKMADKQTDPRRFRRNLPPPIDSQNGNGGVPESAAPIEMPPPMPAPQNCPAWVAHLAPLLPHGLRLATIGLEAESFAPALYQLIPEADLDALELAAADPSFSLTVLEAYPETTQHREWFTRLLEAVRDLILEGAKQEQADTAEQ